MITKRYDRAMRGGWWMRPISLSFIIFHLSISAALLSACGSEDALEPDYRNPSDYFQPAADDQSEEAQLRRQFFSTTGSYLLFNDTIRRAYLGDDINGTPRYDVETVDLSYAIGQSAYVSMHYSFNYLQTVEQKRTVAAFIEDYILPHLTGSLRPYSWLACSTINTWTDTNSSQSHPYAAINQRCAVVAGNYLVQVQRNDTQKRQYAQRVLNIIIGQLASNQSDAFAEFYRYSADYYSRDYSAMGYDGKPGNSELYRIGFLSSTQASTFPSMTTDLSVYALLVIQYSEEQLAGMYADYPIVLAKAAVVRRVLVELGYVF